MRASYTHAAAATSPTVAHRDTDLTDDTGRLRAKGTENMAPIRTVSKQAAERDLRELATQLREALAGHDRHGDGRADSRTVGRCLQVGLRTHEHNCSTHLRQKLIARVPFPFPLSPFPIVLAKEHQIRRREILSAHLDTEPLDPVVRVPQPSGVHESKRESLDHRMRLDRIP